MHWTDSRNPITDTPLARKARADDRRDRLEKVGAALEGVTQAFVLGAAAVLGACIIHTYFWGVS